MVTKMNSQPILIKRGEEKNKTRRPGKLYRMMVKSDRMEAIISELEPHTQSRWYKHDGEEMHLVLLGEMEYTVDKKSYKLSEGDLLWHPSTLKHRANNISDMKTIYITVGTPPTFM
jgi:quercetin dioxygenase-like cupin family protein